MDRAQLLRKSTGKWPILFLFVLLICSLFILRPAEADRTGDCELPFTVNIADDTTDFIPGDGCCSDLLGNCSLRAAIQETNILPGEDTINLPMGRVTLSLIGHSEDAGATGDLDIKDNLNIIGTGASQIDADGIDRVLHIHSGITVTLQALWVINGSCSDDAIGLHRSGGGIFNDVSNLTLQGVEVANNETGNGIGTPGGSKVGGQGGGIFNSGNLVLNSSQVRNNNTGAGFTGFNYGGDGGGIFVDTGAKLTLNGSTVKENITGMGGGGDGIGAPGGRGGGIYISQSPAVGSTTAALTNSYVLDNVTGNGGVGTVGQPGGGGGAGAGIFFIGDLLSLNNSFVSGNVTGNGGAGTNSGLSGTGAGGPGGGIYASGLYGDGVVGLIGSTVNYNWTGGGGANGGRGGTGGGINFTGGGSLTLINSQVNGNINGNGAAANQSGGTGGQGGDGGGIWLYQSPATLIGSTVNSNSAGLGAYGVYQGGVGGLGGGIYSNLAAHSLMFTNSTLNGNSSGNGGNGGSFAANGGHGGGIHHFGGSVSFINSTIIGNVTGNGGGPADQGSGGRGGGVYSKGTLTLENSTVSGNSTGVSGGGGNSFGGFTGGIVASGATNIHNSTISHNTAAFKIGGLQSDGAVNISQTIIANNVSTHGTAPDCSGTLNSLGYVLVENMHFCGFSGDTTTNITGVDPNLGPLQNNGGPTLTHALLSGSPAVDAGNPAICPATDQRGYGRPVDGNGDSSAICDIGAFELQSTESTTAAGLTENVPTTFGATMATLTRQTASIDPMTMTITLKNEPPGGGASDPGEMPLLWTIDAAVNSGLNLDLELCYTDEQLGSIVEGDLEMYRDDGGGWVNMGGTVDTGANCVTLEGVTELSDWTLATDLPVVHAPMSYLYLPVIIKE